MPNEAPKKRGCGLNGNAIKRASGGDHHTARTNGVDEMTFFMETAFWLFVNDMPSIEDCDEVTAERLRVIPTAYKYLLDDKYEAEKDKAYVRRADPSIKWSGSGVPRSSGRLPRWSVKPTARRDPRCPRV